MRGLISLDGAGGTAMIAFDYAACSYTVGDFDSGTPVYGGIQVDDISNVLDD